MDSTDKLMVIAIAEAVKAAASAATVLAPRVEREDIDKLGEETQKLVRETRDRTVEVQKTIRAALRKRKTESERKEWEEKLEQALHPAAAFRVAQELIATLKRYGPKTPEELAQLVGTTAEDDAFRDGLEIAQTDGHILQHRSGVLQHRCLEARTPDSALGEKRFLKRLGLLENRSSRIVEYVHAEGIVTLDDLRREQGLGRRAEDEDRAVFEAALEQLIAEGKVHWLAPSLYGLSPSLLRHHPAREPSAEEAANAENAAQKARQLAAATETLERRLEDAPGKHTAEAGSPGMPARHRPSQKWPPLGEALWGTVL